jgi:tetratricopeptide (TPR) repeat protein
MLINIISKTKFNILIIAICVALFYGSTLQNGYVHDDVWQIAENKNLQGLENISSIFSGCIAESILGGCKNIGFYYRPLQTFGYLLTAQISNLPWFFHLVHLVYGFGAAALVYFFLKILTKKNIYSFIGAILFVTHPVNSEVFNWVSALPELLVTIFTVLSLLMFINFLKYKKISKLILSAIFFFLGLMSKETAVFLIAIIPLYYFLFEFKNTKSVNLKSIVYTSVPFLVVLASYLIVRGSVLGRVVYKYEGYYELSLASQIFTSLKLLTLYLLKLIYPLPLSFQPWEMPVTESGAPVLYGLVAVILISSLIYWLWLKKLKVILFGILIILVGILPSLIFVNKLGEFIFSERYLFFSTIGFSLVIVGLTNLVLPRYKNKLPVWILVLIACYLLLSWFVVFSRNKDWHDNLVSYQAMIRVNPNHKKAHFQIGQIYKNSGEVEKAREQYQKALEIDPNYPEASASLTQITNTYKSQNGLEFYYPQAWKVKEEKGQILIDSGNEVIVQLSVDNYDQSPQDYIAGQTEKYGNLINQGKALIPNFKEAYVRVWNDPKDSTGAQKLEFFLFQGTKVIKVLVSPANSPLMKEFDSILGSLKV